MKTPRLLPALTLLCIAAPAAAGRPVPPSAARPLIYGGTITPSCEWPTTAILAIGTGDNQALCSGTLVHPSIVVYAAHCTADVQTIGFGEQTAANAQKLVKPESCKVYPGHNPENGSDFAYCKLPTPLTGMPITPILMGCELAALRPNKAVTLVGFGLHNNSDTPDFAKRQVTTVQDSLVANKAFVGGNGKDTCFGDSGGPAFIQLTDSDRLPGDADNSWRVYGITSYGLSESCGGGSFDSIMSNGVPWIEADSGIDITPCTDANGVWSPGPDCGGFPMHPNESQGSWGSLCSRTDVSGYSATCGPPFDANSPITIRFAQPVDGNKPSVTNALSAELVVADSDAGGGALSVSLTYDGSVLTRQGGGSSYKFGPQTMDVGDHTLVATAVDAKGNKRVEQLNLTVNEPQGCAQSHGMLGWVGVAAAVILLRGRGTRRLAAVLPVLPVLAVSLALGACGTKVGLTAEALKSVTTTAAPGINPDFEPPPAIALDFNGTIAGQTFTPKSALYLYNEQNDSSGGLITLLYLFVSDQNAYCDSFLLNQDIQGGKLMQFVLQDVGAHVDAPLNGTYPIIDPNATSAPPGTGVAIAQFFVNDANCTSTLTDAQSNAESGNLVLNNILSVQGSYMDFTFTDMLVGQQSDNVSGHITALGCSFDSLPSPKCVAPSP